MSHAAISDCQAMAARSPTSNRKLSIKKETLRTLASGADGSIRRVEGQTLTFPPPTTATFGCAAKR